MIDQWRPANIVMAILFLAIFTHSALCSSSELNADYSQLVEFIKLEDKQRPLRVFHDFKDDFDAEVHQAAIDHLNGQPDLIQDIKADLGGTSVQWRLINLEYRIL